MGSLLILELGCLYRASVRGPSRVLWVLLCGSTPPRGVTGRHSIPVVSPLSRRCPANADVFHFDQVQFVDPGPLLACAWCPVSEPTAGSKATKTRVPFSSEFRIFRSCTESAGGGGPASIRELWTPRRPSATRGRHCRWDPWGEPADRRHVGCSLPRSRGPACCPWEFCHRCVDSCREVSWDLGEDGAESVEEPPLCISRSSLQERECRVRLLRYLASFTEVPHFPTCVYS